MEQVLHIGIDFSEEYVMISYYSFQKKEPETISAISGSKVYKIPFFLAKKRGMGQWYYGEEAKKAVEDNLAFAVLDLYHQSMTDGQILLEGETYLAIDLLTLFLRKILLIPKRVTGLSKIGSLSLCMYELDETKISVGQKAAYKLGIEKDMFFMLDKKECFYYYALSQKAELWQKDCALFYSNGLKMEGNLLFRNERTNPQVVEIEQYKYNFDFMNKDICFVEILKDAFAGKNIGTVYLVGDIFDDEWMTDSLKVLCNGRRVFIGKNLYSKGACVASLVKSKLYTWPFVYIGNHEVKYNLCLKVDSEGTENLYTLISAGESWYEAQSTCEVILCEEAKVEFLLQYPDKSKQTIETVFLNELPCRPPKTTRLRITAKPVSGNEINLSIKDLGFGDMFLASEKTWQTNVSF